MPGEARPGVSVSRRRSRVRVALLVMLAVVVGLLVAADRFGVTLAERTVASRLAATGELTASPTVTIEGFPFLTQALRGRYDQVELRAPGVDTGTVRLSGLDATLRDVRVPLSDALSGSVRSVPVGELDATAVVSYAELSRLSGDRGLTVVREGDLVRVTGEVTALGRTITASALSSLRLDGNAVVLTAESFEVGNQGVDKALSRVLGKRFDLRVPLKGLPFGLTVRSLRVAPQGVVVRADARNTVLSSP